MAEAGSMRFSTQAEYDYFEQERREIAKLQPNEKVVSMFTLSHIAVTNKGTFPAVSIPVRLDEISIEEQRINMQFYVQGSLLRDVFVFPILPNAYINGRSTTNHPSIGLLKGYVRDWNEAIDGSLPEANAAAGIERDSGLLIPAGIA